MDSRFSLVRGDTGLWAGTSKRGFHLELQVLSRGGGAFWNPLIGEGERCLLEEEAKALILEFLRVGRERTPGTFKIGDASVSVSYSSEFYLAATPYVFQVGGLFVRLRPEEVRDLLNYINGFFELKGVLPVGT